MIKEETAASGRLYSIGHSNHSLEALFSLLASYKIQILADVRSQPYSKYTPHFSSSPLQNAARKEGIEYLFYGQELGGRPGGDEFYDDAGHVLYNRLAASPDFVAGIIQLTEVLQKHSVALLCSEENPVHCHRRVLVGRVLAARNIAMDHIRGDGRLQTEADLVVEDTNLRPDKLQLPLFDDSTEKAWNSIKSVSQKKRPRNSSAL